MGGHGGEGRGEGGESGGVGVRVSAYNPLPGQSEPHRSSNVAKKRQKKNKETIDFLPLPASLLSLAAVL